LDEKKSAPKPPQMMHNTKSRSTVGISLLQQEEESLLRNEETNAADANDNIKQGQQAMRSSTKQLLQLLDENAKVTATAGFRPRRIPKNKI
jgi:hypothetical protein